MMTDRLTINVNYILNSQNNSQFNNNFNTTNQNDFENQTKITKDIGKYVKHIKIVKNLLKSSLTALVVF